ncbi:hypothetical protein CPB84DRAFT_1773733 [Gymnopilus junonius]|uniref:Uncharacterized protein n=1 Tax=Gymnopilus junonius TaxID=109634 RepID=A0A9P5TP34_GYMJU|nr:hypothetical protein CPB84DRAFT_1773733 [Gymnopilus junonius]
MRITAWRIGLVSVPQVYSLVGLSVLLVARTCNLSVETCFHREVLIQHTTGFIILFFTFIFISSLN